MAPSVILFVTVSGVRVIRSLVLCVCFVDRWLSIIHQKQAEVERNRIHLLMSFKMFEANVA